MNPFTLLQGEVVCGEIEGRVEGVQDVWRGSGSVHWCYIKPLTIEYYLLWGTLLSWMGQWDGVGVLCFNVCTKDLLDKKQRNMTIHNSFTACRMPALISNKVRTIKCKFLQSLENRINN